MSPVWSMNSGAAGSALILSTAALSVPTTSGLAGLLKPMWLSLICTKLSSPLASRSPISEDRLRLYDFRTPPWITHRAPVPAQAMHLRKPRRSMPSWLWSCKISSFFTESLTRLLLSIPRDLNEVRSAVSGGVNLPTLQNIPLLQMKFAPARWPSWSCLHGKNEERAVNPDGPERREEYHYPVSRTSVSAFY